LKKLSFAIATNNQHKLLEFQNYFLNTEVDLLTPKILGIKFEAEENGATFQENAGIKSKKLFSISGIPSISDDSGICVAALGKEPGIFSARYGNPNFNDKERAFYLLDQMKGCQNREANYQCSIAFTTKDGTIFFDGQCIGQITYDYDETGFGFGYDPIFYYPPLKKRFSQITRDEKAKVSHRGIALRKFLEYVMKHYADK